MTVKTTGAEFLAYYTDDKFWPADGDCWTEDVLLEVNGVEKGEDFSVTEELQAADLVVILNGYVVSREGESKRLETHFKAWQKLQTVEYFSVSAPKDKVEAIKSAILAAGGSIN